MRRGVRVHSTGRRKEVAVTSRIDDVNSDPYNG